MPEFFKVLPPDEALAILWQNLAAPTGRERIAAAEALGRVLFEAVIADVHVPAFARSTMDGYAVRAQDTYGASQTLPAYLTVAGEAPMGSAPSFGIGAGQAALVHTGGMLPEGADAAVMLELIQAARPGGIEVLRAA